MPRTVVKVDKTPQVEAIGARIKAKRKKLGMTQQQVADGRFTSAYISALEKGNAAPSFSSLLHLAKKLKTSPADLLAVDGAVVIDRAILEDVVEQLKTGPVDQWDLAQYLQDQLADDQLEA